MKERDLALDRIKAFATILVVLVHSANVFQDKGLVGEAAVFFIQPFMLLQGCGVPLFFIASGYLLASRPFSYLNNLKTKCRTLLLPYAFWIGLWILVHEIGYRFFGSPFIDCFSWGFSDWWGAVIGDPLPITATFWFVRNLFVLNIIAPLFLYFGRKLPAVSVAGAVLLLYVPADSSTRQTVSFFMLGIVLGFHSALLLKAKQIPGKAIFLLVIVCLFLPYIISTETYSIYQIIVLFSSVGLYALFYKYSDSFPAQFNSTFVIIFRYSFFIFATHTKLLGLLQMIASAVLPNKVFILILDYFLLPCITIPICCLCATGIKRIAPRFYGLITGGR